MSTETRKRMTATEYFAGPETKIRCDLIDGEIIMTPSARWHHEAVVATLITDLGTFLERIGRGKLFGSLDVEIDTFNVLQPDILVILNRALLDAEGRLRGLPNLAIEVLSPSNRKHDLVTKRGIYERAGVPELWLIDIDTRSVVVDRLIDGRYVRVLDAKSGDVESQVVAGFRTTVARIFRGLD